MFPKMLLFLSVVMSLPWLMLKRLEGASVPGWDVLTVVVSVAVVPDVWIDVNPLVVIDSRLKIR